MGHAGHDAIGRRTADNRESLFVPALDGQLRAEAEPMPCPGLIAVRRNDPDVIAQRPGDIGHDGNARRVHAVVIGNEDAQTH